MGNIRCTDRDYVHALILQYPSVEVPASPPVKGIAYRRGQDIVVKLTLKNFQEFRLVGSMTMVEARLRCPGPNTEVSPGVWWNPPVDLPLGFSPSVTAVDLAANGGAQNITYTFTGAPGHVAVGDLEVKYDLPLQSVVSGAWGQNGTNGNFAKWEPVCLVDSTPAGLQTRPWMDYLKVTCRWAWGAVGATDLKEKMVRGMHYSNRSAEHRVYYEYEHSTKFFKYVLGNPLQGTLYLGSMTLSLEQEPQTKLDCADFATSLRVALEGHGVTGTPTRLHPSDGFGFTTNDLCRAGDDSTILANYANIGFAFHVVLWTGGAAFDAAASYHTDPNAGIYMNPPVFWDPQQHWQKWSSGAWHGLVQAGPRAADAHTVQITQLKAYKPL